MTNKADDATRDEIERTPARQREILEITRLATRLVLYLKRTLHPNDDNGKGGNHVASNAA